jgi:hypothetical protein
MPCGEAAKIMREGGSYLAEFDDPITMAERLSGRKVGGRPKSQSSLQVRTAG